MKDISTIKQDRELLIDTLRQAGARIKGNAISCPFHQDDHPSGGVFTDDSTGWKYKCHSCGWSGDVFDVVAKRDGITLTQTIRQLTGQVGGQTPPARPEPQKHAVFASLELVYDYMARKYGGQLTALHEYQTAAGEHVQYMIRWATAETKANGKPKKEMRPLVKTDQGYEMAFPARRVLYRLPAITEEYFVIITEGESKADLLAKYGYQATTSSGGSQGSGQTDWQPLAGKSITIWPDSNNAGHDYAAKVERILQELNPPAQVSIIDPAVLDLTDGEDTVDFVDQLKNAGYSEPEIHGALAEAIGKAKSSGPAAELEKHFEEIFTGRQRSLKTGYTTLDSMVQILPGSINLIVGSQGASKSLLMLQLAARWKEEGKRLVLYELEKNRPFYLKRLMAQRLRNSHFTNNDWLEQNQDTVRQAYQVHKEFIDTFGRVIWIGDKKIISQGDIVEWARQRAAAGTQILIIDPITIADRKDEPHKADAQLIQQLGHISMDYRAIIFLVIHPSKLKVDTPDASAIAGGAAYARFSDNIVWLESHPMKASWVVTPCGSDDVKHDRTLWILKSRDSGGMWGKIAMQFEQDGLTIRESGLIVRKDSHNDRNP